MRDKKRKDFGNVGCIKSEDAVLLVKEDDVQNSWKDYFNKLLNENFDYIGGANDLDDTQLKFCRRTQIKKVKVAFTKMHKKKQLDRIASPLMCGSAWAIRVCRG